MKKAIQLGRWFAKSTLLIVLLGQSLSKERRINFMGDIVEFPKPALRAETNTAPDRYIKLPLGDAYGVAFGYDKVLVIGGPGAGKTYLANKLGASGMYRSPMRTVWCSDVLNGDVPWAEQPATIAHRLKDQRAFVAEGIAVLRALYLGELAKAGVVPDAVVLRDIPIRPLAKVEARLWSQCRRWWSIAAESLTCPIYRIVPGEFGAR